VIRVHDVVVMVTDFEVLYRAQFPRLVSIGVAMTGRRDVATDLAQETMLRAHRRWDDVSTYDARAAWLRKVMVNLLVDQHRSRASERAAVARLSHLSELVAEQPALDRWWEIVGPLPDRQRMIVTLYDADDRSVGEIAALLGVTTGSVKASLFKARRSIERRLNDEEQTDG
jgi:RNA polymerase sigma-70 factor (ECF subfamily)